MTSMNNRSSGADAGKNFELGLKKLEFFEGS